MINTSISNSKKLVQIFTVNPVQIFTVNPVQTFTAKVLIHKYLMSKYFYPDIWY